MDEIDREGLWTVFRFHVDHGRDRKRLLSLEQLRALSQENLDD